MNKLDTTQLTSDENRETLAYIPLPENDKAVDMKDFYMKINEYNNNTKKLVKFDTEAIACVPSDQDSRQLVLIGQTCDFRHYELKDSGATSLVTHSDLKKIEYLKLLDSSTIEHVSLAPLHTIGTLEIGSCPSLRTVIGSDSIRNVSSSTDDSAINYKDVHVYACKNLTELGLKNVTHIGNLKLLHLENLAHLEFYNIKHAECIQLTRLDAFELADVTSGDKSQLFNSLECAECITIEYNHLIRSIVFPSLTECNKIVISDNEEIVTLKLDKLTTCRKLVVRNSPMLESLDLSSLSSVDSLVIENCPKLYNLKLNKLTCAKKRLYIEGCPKVQMPNVNIINRSKNVELYGIDGDSINCPVRSNCSLDERVIGSLKVTCL